MPNVGFGARLKWNGNYVGGITKIGGIDMKLDMEDVSLLYQADVYKQFIPQGLIEASDIPVEGFFEPSDTTGQVAMATDFAAKTLRTAIVEYPASTGATLTVSAYITNLSQTGEANSQGALPFKASLKITGAPVFAIATSTGLTTPFFTINNSAVISPAASGSVYDYVATVLTGVTSVVVTPTAAAGVIVLTANGASQTITSGQASSAIALGAAGSITIITITVTETNKASKTYTIRVDRP